MHGASQGSDRGIIPRAIESIFERVQASKTSERVDIAMSCVEIYQEKLFDLLLTREDMGYGCPETPLRIRQHPDGEVWVEVSLTYPLQMDHQPGV